MQPYWDWVARHAVAEEEARFISINSLAPWFGFPERAKLTRTQSFDLVNVVSEMGWQMAPQADHVDICYTWEQEVAVYQVDQIQRLDSQMSGLIRLLYLVMPVASADGTVEIEELETFHRLVANEIRSDAEWKYLYSVEKALMRDTNAAVRSLSTVAKRITSKNREGVFRLLIHIAAADGEISPEELKVLGRIARALELPQGLALEIIKQDLAFAEVVVSEGKPSARKGEPIPEKQAVEDTSLVLNMDRIAALTQETHEVVSMLSEVMAEEESQAMLAEPSEGVARPAPSWLDGLNPRYHSVFLEIVEMDAVPLEKLENLANRHHLIVDDIFNSINAWADESLGDFLLERSDPVQVYRNLLPVDQTN